MNTVEIWVGGEDITQSVIFADAEFEQQMNAVPGSCKIRVLDPDQVMSFTTGQEIRLFIDGSPQWGGYLRRKRYTYPFAADDTTSPTTYRKRIWVLEGSDYNILWDARVIRRTSNYVGHVPDETGYVKSTMDGWAIWKLLHSFSDFPSGFGITSDRSNAADIDDVRTVLPSSSNRKFFYKQQGSPLREQMDEFAAMAGAAYYIGADKRVHYHAYESVVKRWGFSDNPNRVPLTASPLDFQDSTWGFYEVTGEEDGEMLVTDALIWGGSPAGSDGDVLFARYQSAVEDVSSTSTTYIQHGDIVADSPLDRHGRWQVGEVHTEGGMYGNLDGVKARANVLLHGPSGTSAKGDTKGFSNPIWQFSFNWRAWQVPEVEGIRDHILAGDLVRVELATFGVAQFVPCRSIRITFENLDAEGDAFATFAGEFSYSYSDSVTLWKALLKANKRAGQTPVAAQSTANDSSTTADYGAIGSFSSVPAPDGATTEFALPNGLGYVTGTLDVYINGLIQRRGVDYVETSGSGGTFTMTSVLTETDTIQVICRTLAT